MGVRERRLAPRARCMRHPCSTGHMSPRTSSASVLPVYAENTNVEADDPSVERATRLWRARPIRRCSWDGAVRRRETIRRDSRMVLPPALLKKRHLPCAHIFGLRRKQELIRARAVLSPRYGSSGSSGTALAAAHATAWR